MPARIPEEGTHLPHGSDRLGGGKGILSKDGKPVMRSTVEKDTAEAESTRLVAIAFRETVYRVFVAVAGKQIPAQADIASYQ